MSKFKNNNFNFPTIIDYDLCVETIFDQMKEIEYLRHRVKALEIALKDASFQEWAECYDNWYSKQINFDFIEEINHGN
jgi:hypothetical protein